MTEPDARWEIQGEIAQTVRIHPGPGEEVWASKRSLMSYSTGLEWQIRVPGGIEGALRRSFSGEGISLTHIAAGQEGAEAVLTANQPGHLMVWHLDQGPIVTTRGAFLAAMGTDLDIDVTIARRAGAAFFGGAGLFLQRVSGTGVVFVHGSGDFREFHLGASDVIMASTGNLAAFSDDVDYDIERVGGARRILFGGEGLFVTRLQGPGSVFLQSLKRGD